MQRPFLRGEGRRCGKRVLTSSFRAHLCGGPTIENSELGLVALKLIMSKGSAHRRHLKEIEKRVFNVDAIVVSEACICIALGVYLGKDDCCVGGWYHECCCAHVACICKEKPENLGEVAKEDKFNCSPGFNCEYFRPVFSFRSGGSFFCFGFVYEIPCGFDELPVMCALEICCCVYALPCEASHECVTYVCFPYDVPTMCPSADTAQACRSPCVLCRAGSVRPN